MERWDRFRADRRVLFLFGALFVLLVGLGGFIYHETSREPAMTVVKNSAAEERENGPRIFVYVAGAVKNPGVYEMPAESRVYEAVAAAGGFLPYAEEETVEMAGFLKDGMSVYVPLAPERTEPSAPGETRVNINTASLLELRSLPGIGEVTAAKIVEWREKHGGFKKAEDLMEVPSIGQGRFAKLADRITV